jgi:hypothetical protein
MSLLSKEQILSTSDAKTVSLYIEEWGGDVIISTMSGHARDQFEASLVGKNGGTNLQNIRAKLAAATIVDEQGNLMFTDKDVAALGKKSAAALDRVFSASQKLNRISDGDVEELAKN